MGACTGPERPIGRVGVGTDSGEQIGPVRGAHDRTDVGWRPAVGDLAPGGQEHYLVAGIQMGEAMSHHQHDAPGVGESAQHRHDLAVQRRV